MLQITSPHVKIELDDDQQLALVNVYKLLIRLAENPKDEDLQPSRAVGNEIRMD
jgi:hypothetical protein